MNNFIIKKINKDINNGLSIKKIKFRFPPEPNGYLHIGHIKAIYINFKLAEIYKAKINLRFDDTNPYNEHINFVKEIKNNIKWLGFRWSKITYTSDYFNILYKWAKKLIKKKKAYIEYNKNNKIYNLYNIKENLYHFKQMKDGKYKENSYVLRAKIDINSPNYHLRNPIMYRIIKKKHYRTKNKWCIFPTYDWAHGQSDYIEKITHSLCSIEFQNHNKLYNWFLKYIYNKKYNNILPKQIEFSRLNIYDTITSKRHLNILIKKKIIKKLDDPRLSTISSFKKKGYNPKYIINFIKNIGYSKRYNKISINKLELEIKKKIIKTSPKVMVLFNPIKIIINNFPKKLIEWIYIKKNKNFKKQIIPFTREIYIEKNDFKEKYDKNFFRLSSYNYVRLKYSYIIKAYKIIKKKKKIIKIFCNFFKKKKKIKSTIQWISKKYKKKIKILDYNYIFFKKKKIYNKKSIKIIKAYIDLTINNLKLKKIYQFHRIGFFYLFKKNKFKKIIYMKKKY